MVEKTLKRDGFRAQTSFYHWDEEDRLIRVSLPNGDIWHYEYDVFGKEKTGQPYLLASRAGSASGRQCFPLRCQWPYGRENPETRWFQGSASLLSLG
uniref:RHS repeat domain-containing protein n=1 Tax=Shewanella chilikensis TaxID=558541 RepID=UPI001CFB13F0